VSLRDLLIKGVSSAPGDTEVTGDSSNTRSRSSGDAPIRVMVLKY
jgi:hypothetical protein